MADINRETVLCPDGVWIISDGRYRDLDLRLIFDGAKIVTAKEYRISDLAYYMLAPHPIEVKKKLIGCEVHRARPFSGKLKAGAKKCLPRFTHNWLKEKPIEPEIIITDLEFAKPALSDNYIEAHFEKICQNLRPYNSVIKQLDKMTPKNIADIIGICVDIGGARSTLLIKGDIEEKIAYMSSWVSQDVSVTLDRSYVANGLFEIGGYDFESYNNQISYRLVTFLHDGEPKSLVLDDKNRVKFTVDDVKLVRYMQLLENCLKANPKMKEALDLCKQGSAQPSKILFNQQMEIGYSSSRIPEIYREAFESCDVGVNEIDTVMSSLNTSQFGIAFSYIPGADEDRVFTTISVMHDFRALDNIKTDLPKLYSEISKKTTMTDAGTYYLLDAIRGYNNG